MSDGHDDPAAPGYELVDDTPPAVNEDPPDSDGPPVDLPPDP